MTDWIIFVIFVLLVCGFIGICFFIYLKLKAILKRIFRRDHISTAKPSSTAKLRRTLAKARIGKVDSSNISKYVGKQVSGLDIGFSGRFLTLRRPDFHGPFTKSPNEEFLLAWADPGSHGDEKRTWGIYLLIADERILSVGNLERPNTGKVADNGRFILNDWTSTGNLEGVFYAFNKDGERLVKHRFKANLDKNGISVSGRYAACSTAHSDNVRDSKKVAVFDLEDGSLVSKISPVAFEFADQISIDEGTQTLILDYRQGYTHHYHFDGKFLDGEQWRTDRVRYANPAAIAEIADELIKELESNDLSDYEELISNIKKRIAEEMPQSNRRALLFRRLGEIYLKCADEELALKNLEIAMEINPRVGIKREAETLRSKLKNGEK